MHKTARTEIIKFQYVLNIYFRNNYILIPKKIIHVVNRALNKQAPKTSTDQESAIYKKLTHTLSTIQLLIRTAC